MSLSIDSLLSNYTRFDKQLYQSVDRNKDSIYSKQEVSSFAADYEKSTGESIDVDSLFKAYDVDLSGAFSGEEYAKVIEDDAMHMSVLSGVKKEEAEAAPEQLDLFTDYEAQEKAKQAEDAALEKETRRQKALLNIRDKYGKNAVVRGLNLQDGATAIERNAQIGGHKA